MTEPTRHIVSILVEDSPGELARIVGLFSGRGFNIDSLAVNRTTEPRMSRVVLVTRADEKVIEQITKQLNKLIRVHKGIQHPQGTLERELVVLTLRCQPAKSREDIERICKLTGARTITYTAADFTVELTANAAKVDDFIELCRPLGIRQMVRSAPVAFGKPGESAESDTFEATA